MNTDDVIAFIRALEENSRRQARDLSAPAALERVEHQRLLERLATFERDFVIFVEGVEVRSDKNDLCRNATRRARERYPELFVGDK